MLQVLTFFGWASMPKKDGKYHLEDDHKEQLNQVTGKEGWADVFLEKVNEELKAEEELKQAKADKKSAEEKLADLLASKSEAQKSAAADLKALAEATGIEPSGEDEEEEIESDDVNALEAQYKKQLKIANDRIKQLVEENKTLANQEVPDNPELISIPNMDKSIKHSATHVYASGKSYDAVAGRQWNQNLIHLANGDKTKVKATDWTNKLNIDKINEDLDDFARQDMSKVIDLMGDYRKVPEWWEVISNVDDKIAYTSLINGEITQARKKKFLAKNKQKFVAMIGQVYPVQIDITWEGWQLQKIETSWMNRYNREGSQAYKKSFVEYLIMTLIEQARKEDNQVLIKGVYFPNEDAEAPMSFIHRARGLKQLASEARGKYYHPFALGKPTKLGIVDYVKNFAKSLPEEVQDMPDLILYFSKSWERTYYEQKKIAEGVNQDYDPDDRTVEGFDNIQLYGLDFLDGEDFMFITTRDNIKILENVPEEKSMIHLDLDKRDVHAFGDYKQGIMVEAFGEEINDSDPIDFKKQIFWSNDVEVNTKTYIPVDPGDATPSVKYHNVLQTGENTGATTITNFDDAVDGKFYYIRGNSEGTPSTIANNGNFNLASSPITLDGNTLVKFYKIPSGKFIEVQRWDLAKDEFFIVDADATTIDASDTESTAFMTSENTQATELTDIENAVEGTVYKLQGGSDANATTITAAGKFSRITADMTLGLGDYIKVVYNGSKFVELERFAA